LTDSGMIGFQFYRPIGSRRNDPIKNMQEYIASKWEKDIIPTLMEYIKIPSLSPMFDKQWETNGLMAQAVQILLKYAKAQTIAGMTIELIEEKGVTPLIFIEIPATMKDAPTVLMYGHADKQPPMTGWEDTLGPYTPVIRDNKLYGRAGADDGYAIFASLLSIEYLQSQGIPHSRVVLIIENSEESGSPDLKFHIDKLSTIIGTPNFVVCLDSGCQNYDQMWLTTSLRGMVSARLDCNIIKEGVHSGKGSGIIPDSFRICRQLLSRLEDEDTGKIKPETFYAEIPDERIVQAIQVCNILGDEIINEFPFVGKSKPISDNLQTLVLNRTWKPQLTVTGASGLPDCDLAGNVMRPGTSLKLSLRLPPTVDATNASKELIHLLESSPPYGSDVSVKVGSCASGWNAPPLEDWLSKSLNESSSKHFGKPCGFVGEGGSIPFIGMLGHMFPKAQFCITGLLGPNSNAHGPNEFLHIPFAIKLTCCIVDILADHAKTK
jgi:acetylornithine deacetylase/succinyl-diaminopimelate desuccinylase-like protein